MKKRITIIISFLLLLINAPAQESTTLVNEDGKDYTKLKYAWRAQWITHPTASTLDFGSFLFRRVFELDAIPKKLNIYVSGDNVYKLYVNGSYVGMGPETGDLLNYKYETYDIAKYLKKGKNVVAAEVINYGEYRKASQQTFQTAFICQFDDALNCWDLNTGKAGWKTLRNEGRGYIPFVSDSLKFYYAAGPRDILDAKKFPWNWQTLNYDDSNWTNPKLCTVEFAVGRGFLYGSTWFLVPRKLPVLEEKIERFSKMLTNRTPETTEFDNFKNELIIPANSKQSILFDNQLHTIGYPELTFSKGKNSKIKITYAESLVDSSGHKGNRNVIKNKKIFGYYDIVLPDGGEKRVFKTTSMRAYRYVQIDVETSDNELIIDDFHGVRTAYPLEVEGSFHCDNDTVNLIWETSCRTLLNSIYEDYIDPYYEQLQYIGDTRLEGLITYSMSNDKRLIKKAIESFDNSRQPIGLTQSRYPSYITQIIPPFSLIWIAMIHDFMMYDGDKEFIKDRAAGMESVLNWFKGKLDNNNMIGKLDWWNFTDWAIGFPNGNPVGSDNGYSATINLQYVMALQKAAEIYEYLGNKTKQSECLSLAKNVRKAVFDNCFDTRSVLFAETPEKKIFSQHTNILAILTDAIPVDKQAQLMQRVLNDKSIIQTTIYFKFYLFEALSKVKMGNEYLNLLQNWKNMLNDGLTTFAETDINPRSDCHAWSATPVYHLHKIIAGVKPTKPGFKGILIEPNFFFLKSYEAKIPHPSGIIEISMKKEDSNYILHISLPKGEKAILVWKDKRIYLNQEKQIINLPE